MAVATGVVALGAAGAAQAVNHLSEPEPSSPVPSAPSIDGPAKEKQSAPDQNIAEDSGSRRNRMADENQDPAVDAPAADLDGLSTPAHPDGTGAGPTSDNETPEESDDSDDSDDSPDNSEDSLDSDDSPDNSEDSLDSEDSPDNSEDSLDSEDSPDSGSDDSQEPQDGEGPAPAAS